MKLTIGLILIAANIWSCFHFYAWPNVMLDKLLKRCHHKWLDTTVPFSDYEGGWHVCTQCQARKYIKWGYQYQRLKEHGQIAEDTKVEAELMDQYTGFSKIARLQ